MTNSVLFAGVGYDKYDAGQTLPARFRRMIDRMGLAEKVKDKNVAVKMHVGVGLGITTIHPLYVKTLVDKLKEYGAKPFVTDVTVAGARVRGYTAEYLDCPVVDVCGLFDKYFYPVDVDFKTFKNVDVAGHIKDADFMVDLSHVKGHGACGYGGACKNIAMGCVTGRTRTQIHHLEGGIVWNEDLCTHCEQCIKGCNHNANSFTKEGKYDIFFHNCTFCQHCVKVCPTGAVVMDDSRYEDFQTGMALCTKTVLDAIGPENVYYINFLTDITALCDCWGLSTPSLVPDIGVMSSRDMVALERACLDAIKTENLIMAGVPAGADMSGQGHLFERLHGKDPFVQLRKLAEYGVGSEEYGIEEVE